MAKRVIKFAYVVVGKDERGKPIVDRVSYGNYEDFECPRCGYRYQVEFGRKPPVCYYCEPRPMRMRHYGQTDKDGNC
ncbi:MAG: hypothetical protein HXX08_11450 [Chloroflexi bacterium]|uniref:Uncharacterized protein n=1 Tax=Candidatus Chlorohelix allophototropha TaxID=3003348 RepID=A0A8T7M3N5_9CHLR|nr:hypothetical protein [Chloroflexota bacterium]WJW65853.1 hypothetical protein OZ401_001632 [Chloroflexota bacterium L227-S17]